MMRMSGRVTSCCVALLLALTSVSAVQRLNSINDLKKINFGQSVPKHSLLLLHWFANIVEIDNNDVIQLTFDPNNRDYGSHHYGNYERLLDQLPYGHRYYTVGNLYEENSEQLPDYVVHPRREYAGANRDRIVFTVREHNTGRQSFQRIDRVYITQHYENSEPQGEYDPDHTYEITAHLLRQIREFSVGANQQSLREVRDHFGSNADDFQLCDIRITWGNLACLGLLLFIVIQEGCYFTQHKFSMTDQNKTTLTHTKCQHAASTNTQFDYFGNFPENRQNNGNAGNLQTCTVVLKLLLIIFLVFAFFVIFSSGRNRW